MNRNEGEKLGAALKEHLCSKGVPVQSLYLFGSVARSQATPESDIDFAVITPKFLSTRWQEKGTILYEGTKFNIRIEALQLYPEELQNPYSSLAEEIRTHGIAC